MSIFKKQTVVESFPAFDVVVREKKYDGVIEVTAGEVITDDKMLRGWEFGSVVSYSLQNNMCPLESAKRAETHKEPLHWLNPVMAVLTSSAQETSTRILIQKGDVIKFEGRLFTVESAANDNKKLVPYSPE